MTVSEAEDDFSRKVFCLLGVPIDDITMGFLVERIARAAASRTRLFISTPNLNFLVLSQYDPAFRRSLVESDICPVDGIGVLLLAKLLGIPIQHRVSGSDIPNALMASSKQLLDRPISMAFFGGKPGIGELACDAINSGATGRLICAGAIDPGIMDQIKMTDPLLINKVNATSADFLLVALGAEKGQAWLMRNIDAVKIPVVSHLGATLNFLAGVVERAPVIVRKLGLEWLWRIKEEPLLASRYLSDGVQLLWLLLNRVIPLAFWLRWNGVIYKDMCPKIEVFAGEARFTTIKVDGAATNKHLGLVVMAFRNALLHGKSIVLDLSSLLFFEMGFTGYIIMLEKLVEKQNQSITIVGTTATTARVLTWCGLKHLIASPSNPWSQSL